MQGDVYSGSAPSSETDMLISVHDSTETSLLCKRIHVYPRVYPINICTLPESLSYQYVYLHGGP
jgi:hypothetical protein